MANLHLVTGFAGQEHVTSADQGAFNAAVMGSAQTVFEKGNQFAASIIDNNTVRVLDGELMMQGRYIRLNKDTYVDLTIENGAQGYLRNDLIVVRYAKDTVTAVESADLVVIKGEPAASNPADPEFTEGNILTASDLQNDMPLFRVSINGLSIESIVPLFDTFGGDTLPGLVEAIKKNALDISNLDNSKAASVHKHSASDINSGTLSVARGGTGAGTAEVARKNLDVYSKTEVDMMADAIGSIKTTIRTDLGEDWLLCNGEELDASAYPALYSILPGTPGSSWTLHTDISIIRLYTDSGYIFGFTNNSDGVFYYKENFADDWTAVSIGQSYRLIKVKKVGSYWVAIHDYGYYIAYSTNLASGTWSTYAINPSYYYFFDVVYNGKYYVALMYDSYNTTLRLYRGNNISQMSSEVCAVGHSSVNRELFLDAETMDIYFAYYYMQSSSPYIEKYNQDMQRQSGISFTPPYAYSVYGTRFVQKGRKLYFVAGGGSTNSGGYGLSLIEVDLDTRISKSTKFVTTASFSSTGGEASLLGDVIVFNGYPGNGFSMVTLDGIATQGIVVGSGFGQDVTQFPNGTWIASKNSGSGYYTCGKAIPSIPTIGAYNYIKGR